MGMPRDLVFVRHGESEANVFQQAQKKGAAIDFPSEITSRPDWMHRLSPRGIEQAKAAGQWIEENIGNLGETFDARYCSPFIRTRETAVHLGGAALSWHMHNMLHERDWGHYGSTARNQQQLLYPRTHHLRETAPLYARPDGGEALADSVALRVRDFRDTAMRKWDNKRILAVTHGDVMCVVRYVFEGMLPEEWHEMEKDPAQCIGNCALLWYTRVNPEDPGDIRPYVGWRRMIQPDNLQQSPFNGEWIELPDDRFVTGEELLKSIEKIPRLLPEV